MNKKGFTLIELLAVIIILGILMIIAIPSVTKYINDSRKSAYIDTARELVSGAKNLVNEGTLEMFDTDTTYYIASECIKTENDTKSPYGEFLRAYIVVNFDGKGYDYFWTSVDDSGQGISKITGIDRLDIDLLESDLSVDDVPYSYGVDGRTKYMIINKEQSNCKKGVSSEVSDIVNGKTGTSPVTYPEGKNKQNSDIGEIVKIGDQEFYIIKRDGNNLYLLTRYNLNVGPWPYRNDPVGPQSQYSVAYGSNDYHYGMVPFSSSPYWLNQIGEGKKYPGNICGLNSYIGNCVEVFDENSKLYSYVNDYKNYLKDEFGVYVKEARLMNSEEVHDMYYGGYFNSFTDTYFWTDVVASDDSVLTIWNDGTTYYAKYNSEFFFGVRPVIVI